MSKKYSIRVYESRKKDGMTCAGTVVEPLDMALSIYADSGDAAESQLCKDVEAGKLLRGRIYQICPSLSVPELIRSMAASLEGSFERVFLDPAAGLYSEARRVRLPDFSRPRQEEPTSLAQVLGY
jgi:hypothetical protein